jgi:hypothetical protein
MAFSAPATSSRPRSHEEQQAYEQAWLQRISSVQREKATPDQLQAMRQKQESARRTEVLRKKSDRMSKSLQLSSSAFHLGVSHASTPGAARGSAPAARAMTMLSAPDFLSPTRSAAACSLEEEEAAEEALGNALSMTAQQLAMGPAAVLDVSDVASAVAPTTPATQLAVKAQQERKLDETLSQLTTEPADDEARAAKFELYEGFAKLTEDARTATHELWATTESEFDSAPAVKAQIARDIKSIDRTDNLGLHDNERVWFVHGMCKATARNQTTINGILSGITTKLEMMAVATECPICFDAFGPERPATTLSCAHKCCAECWENWSKIARGSATCPLCRHENFLHQVLSAADGAS